MPILQRDANNNTQSIKTLNDINAGDPLPVQIAQTINATDTAVQTRLGSTNSIPAAEPTSDAGLNGVFKGYWQSFKSFLTILGTLSDTAATDGSLMARLRYIATNGTGGGGGTTNATGVESRLGNTDETAATTDAATSGLNGLIKRYLGRFTAFLGILGTTSDTASATGTLMARLGAIASSGTGGATPTYSSPVDIAAVTITTATTTVAEIVTADWAYLSLWVQNTGTVALSELKTEAGLSASLEFKYAFLAGATSSGSYTTGTGKQSGNSLIPIIFANNLPTIAGGGEGFVEIDVRRYQRIRLQASVATGTTTVVVNGILTR